MAEDTIINLDFENTWEPESVPEGEYQLRVTNAELKAGKKGPGLQLSLDIPSYPHSKDISHWFNLPKEGDDIKTINKRTRAIENCLIACGFAPGPFAPEQLIGAEPFAYLVEEEDEEYGKQNRVRRWLKGA